MKIVKIWDLDDFRLATEELACYGKSAIQILTSLLPFQSHTHCSRSPSYDNSFQILQRHRWKHLLLVSSILVLKTQIQIVFHCVSICNALTA